MLALRENQWRSTQSEKSNPFLKGFNHEVLISRRIDAQDMFASDALTTIQSAFRQLDLAADCSAQAAVMRDRLLAKQYCRIQTATARHSGHTWRWRTAYRQQRHGTMGTLGAGALDTDSNGTAQDTDSDQLTRHSGHTWRWHT
jgi:hypothetical protein